VDEIIISVDDVSIEVYGWKKN